MSLEKPCLPYAGRIRADGYGSARKGKLAHRVAYCTALGLPESAIAGVFIRHRCDNRCCVEPTHLEPGSHEDNMRDMRERGRSNRGERHGSAKVTRAQVAEIRRRFTPYSKKNSAAALGREFGLAKVSIRRILNGTRWQEGFASLSH